MSSIKIQNNESNIIANIGSYIISSNGSSNGANNKESNNGSNIVSIKESNNLISNNETNSRSSINNQLNTNHVINNIELSNMSPFNKRNVSKNLSVSEITPSIFAATNSTVPDIINTINSNLVRSNSMNSGLFRSNSGGIIRSNSGILPTPRNLTTQRLLYNSDKDKAVDNNKSYKAIMNNNLLPLNRNSIKNDLNNLKDGFGLSYISKYWDYSLPSGLLKMYLNNFTLFFNNEKYEILYRDDLYINLNENLFIMLLLCIYCFGVSIFQSVFYSTNHELTIPVYLDFGGIGFIILAFILSFSPAYITNSQDIIGHCYFDAGMLLAVSTSYYPSYTNAAIIIGYISIGHSFGVLFSPFLILSSSIITLIYVILSFILSDDRMVVLIHALSIILINIYFSLSSYRNDQFQRRTFVLGKINEDDKVKLKSEAKELRAEMANLIGENIILSNKEIDLAAPIEKAMLLLRELQTDEQMPQDAFLKLQKVIKFLSTGHDLFKPQIEQQLSKGSNLDLDTQAWLISLISNERLLLAPSTPSHANLNIDKKEINDIYTSNILGSELQLTNIVSRIDDFDFDVFDVVKLTTGKPLLFVGFVLLRKFNLFEKLKLNQIKVKNFLTAVENSYRDNPYHNSTHAADVTQTFNYFISVGKIHSKMTDLELLSSFIACLIHDIDHPGRTNAFHIATKDKKAILYNDRAVLEMHHAATGFIILNKPENNFLEDLPSSEYNELRKIVIDMVLSTDLGQHFDFINQFKQMVAPGEGDYITDSKDRMIVLKMIIKCADVSHTSKIESLHIKWTQRIIEEFYRQGDDERKCGLPISPFMDRQKANVPKAQTGFIDILVKPMYETWTHFLKDSNMKCLQQLLDNRQYWKAQEK